METVAVLGAGSIGTALAQVAATNGCRVRAWSIEARVVDEIRDRRTNSKHLPGVRLHEGVEACPDFAAAIAGAGLVIISVPSQAVRAVAKQLAPHITGGQVVLNAAKGLEASTHSRMSEVLAEEFAAGPPPHIASMGGPAIAIEMARGDPTAVIVGADDPAAGRRIQRLFQNTLLKVETTGDICGVELCAASKNVYAIALGLCDGLRYGANTKAFVASLALAEMAVVCAALGGRHKTPYGLAGLGDLLTTGFSEHSRNRTFGEKMGAGADWQEFLRTKTVEGVPACRTIEEMIRGRGLRTPLLDAIHGVLTEGRPAAGAMRAFFRQFEYG